MDDSRHVGAAAPARPEAPADAEAGAPPQSAGERVSPAAAPSPVETAGPGQAATAPAAVEGERAAELPPLSPPALADAPAGKAEGEDRAAETAVGGESLPRPAVEPEDVADPEAAEPEGAVAEAVPTPDAEPQVAEAAGGAEQAAAEAQPQVLQAVAAAPPGAEQAAEAVAAAGPAEPREPQPVAVAEPELQTPVAVDAAVPAPEAAEAVVPAEPEPRMPAAVEPAGAQPDLPDVGQVFDEAQARRTEPETGTEAQLARADIVAPPVERAGLEAPQPLAAEAPPSSPRRTEPPAPAAVLLRGQPARAWAARLPASLPSRQTAGEYLPYLRLAARGAAAVAAGLVAIVLTLVVLYRWVDPPTSTLMLGQRLGGTPIDRRWVPLERISPHLVKAVILSEDGGFCRHRGVDWGAMEEAIESARGGSTITMQVVKNLFLWPSRSYVRKAIEIGLAYLVEAIWPKRRILEIYLNIAEWGDGVFGAEAAARHHFGKSAARLTATEAALLAVALPSPAERTAGSPSPGMSRLANRLLTRMAISQASLACVRAPPRLAGQAR